MSVCTEFANLLTIFIIGVRPAIIKINLCDFLREICFFTIRTNFFENFSYNVLEIGKTSYIKRVIGLPGDHVQIKNGKVYINEEELEEDYLQPGIITDDAEGIFYDIIVPENTVFAMGDNRNSSVDCRGFGCIPLEKIEGKVLIRFWPLNEFGKVEE